ncbi:MAG: hypothetical protein PHZ26_00030 [Candidatus Gracilibacteria bacterium]|nr:hypothetical protein [Candidatus Gracilibacteria bacterium]MDD2908124.1 hypothetical protein [Candidatus Gracilibacteria bacterium]
MGNINKEIIAISSQKETKDSANEEKRYLELRDLIINRLKLPEKLKDGVLYNTELLEIATSWNIFAEEYKNTLGKDLDFNQYIASFDSLGNKYLDQLKIEIGLLNEEDIRKVKIEFKEGELITIGQYIDNSFNKIFGTKKAKDAINNGTKKQLSGLSSGIDKSFTA